MNRSDRYLWDEDSLVAVINSDNKLENFSDLEKTTSDKLRKDLTDYQTKGEGTCKHGQTAAQTDCTPASGEPVSKKQESEHKLKYLLGSDTEKKVANFLKSNSIDLDNSELLAGGGYPGGSDVHVFISSWGNLVITIEHPDINDWTNEITPKGTMVITSAMLEEGSQGKGLGTSIFVNQALWAYKNKIKAISLLAGKKGDQNGYYTWPRLGFDVDLTKTKLLAKVKQAFPSKDIKMLSDLMRFKQGREWWKKNGIEIRMTFDTSPNSRSMKILKAYIKERGKR